jgi:tetratricopeptide (TPR) repeat protein
MIARAKNYKLITRYGGCIPLLLGLLVFTIDQHSTRAANATQRAESARFSSEAKEQFAKKHYQAAIPLLDKAVQLDPDNYDAVFARGIVHMKLGETEKAIPDLLQGTNHEPGNKQAWVELADAYLSVHKWQESVDCLTRVISCTKGQGERRSLRALYHTRSTAYHALKEFDKAIADQTKAVENSANPSLDIGERARLYADAGNNTAAFADYARAIKLAPDRVNCYKDRAKLYFDTKQYDLAVKDWTSVIRINPTFIAAYLERSKAYEKLGKHDLAQQDLVEAKKVESEM